MGAGVGTGVAGTVGTGVGAGVGDGVAGTAFSAQVAVQECSARDLGTRLFF